MFYLKNLDAAITITIQYGSGSTFLSLKPGESACGRFGSSVAPKALSGSATPQLKVLIFED